MDFDLSKPQKLLKQSAREFLARECKPERVRALMATETAHDEALWAAIVDQGWTGLIVPEEMGGLGLGIVELAAVFEEAGRVCLPGPLFSTTFAAAVLIETGHREGLEKIATGELKATVALNTAFVLDAEVADVLLYIRNDGVASVTARTTRRPSMDETRKVYSIDIDRVGDIMTGNLEKAVDVATVALCAEMVGGMQWVLDTTVAYAKTRTQFGKPIGAFQAVQHQCADMLLMTESARSAMYYAAWALTQDDPHAGLAASMAKAYCSDAYREVCNRGIQVHGGIGFTWEHDLQLYFKRAKASETMFGDAIHHRERIASRVVD